MLKRIVAWCAYLVTLTGIACGLWWLVVKSWEIPALIVLVAGIGVALCAPSRAPERIP